MLRKHSAIVGVLCLIVFGGVAAGAVMAHQRSRFEQGSAGSPFGGWPNRLSDVGATSRVAIIQVLDAWAENQDAGNSEATAQFTPQATLSLFYNDTATTPYTLVPTGYSPSSTPTGGTAGRGCTVTGTSQISAFMAGESVGGFGPGATTNPYPTPFRTYVMDPVVDSWGTHAFVQSYLEFFNGNFQGGKLIYEALLQTRMRYTRAGWQISDMKIIFESPQPNYPCQN